LKDFQPLHSNHLNELSVLADTLQKMPMTRCSEENAVDEVCHYDDNYTSDRSQPRYQELNEDAEVEMKNFSCDSFDMITLQIIL
jgi:hypothetical protein